MTGTTHSGGNSDTDRFLEHYFGNQSFQLKHLSGDGSHRRYFRVEAGGVSFILCENANLKENERYIELSRFFYPVVNIPYIYSVSRSKYAYLIQDFGDDTLKNVLSLSSPAVKMNLYKKAVDLLINFQLSGTKIYQKQPGLFSDFDICSDCLNLFRVYFLNFLPPHQSFPDSANDDFRVLMPLYEQAKPNGVVMGDFQPRNILCNKNQLALIDFQDTFLGNSMYDLSSLLMSGSFPPDHKERDVLLDYYFDNCEIFENNEKNRKTFYLFLVLRRIRSLGTYAKLRNRQIYYQERFETCIEDFISLKPHIIKYIPIHNLFGFLDQIAGNMPKLSNK